MLHEKYNDPINVSVLFLGDKVLPKVFVWGNHKYDVEKVLNIYSTYQGQERVHYFSVATETDFFKIQLNTETLKWTILEHYQE